MSFIFYQFQHKAIRNFFSEINLLCGSTNFQSVTEVEFLRDRILKLMSLLASHSYIEEQVILPALRKNEIELSDKDSHDHKKLDDKLFQVIGKIQKLVSVTDESQEQGNILYLLFTGFQAEYLLHMIHEETETATLLLNNLSPIELSDLKETISKRTPAPIMKDWLTYGLPAMNQIERIEVLKPMVSNVPAESLPATLSIVKNVLDEADFRSLMAGLNLKFV
jgi:hypothetical protein